MQRKHVLILGGSSGIGFATAQRVLAAGAKLLIAGREKAKLAAAAPTLGEGVEAVALDATNEPEVEALFANRTLDHLVVSAGPSRLGSITLFSGLFGRRPIAGSATVAAANAAIEGLGRALARELAPVRVNVISPGLVDTPAYAAMPEAARRGVFEATARALPAGRVGKPENLAAAVVFAMDNPYLTGAVLDVDGGGGLV